MINKSNTAFILYSGHMGRKYIESEGFNVFSPLKNTNKFTRRVLNFARRNNNQFIERLFFNAEINNKEFENYIVYDATVSSEYIKWLHEHHMNSRIILFYDNPIANTDVDIKTIDRSYCECWSFDFTDCMKYKLKYNSEFYFSELKISNQDNKYDIMFLGRDKGRYNKLLELEKIFKELGLASYFHIVADNKIERYKKVRYKPQISYTEVLDLVSKSNVLLDILQDEQTGLTLRDMEAVFFNKKLITDNKEIINYNFYSSDNVFVLII